MRDIFHYRPPRYTTETRMQIHKRTRESMIRTAWDKIRSRWHTDRTAGLVRRVAVSRCCWRDQRGWENGCLCVLSRAVTPSEDEAWAATAAVCGEDGGSAGRIHVGA